MDCRFSRCTSGQTSWFIFCIRCSNPVWSEAMGKTSSQRLSQLEQINGWMTKRRLFNKFFQPLWLSHQECLANCWWANGQASSKASAQNCKKVSYPLFLIPYSFFTCSSWHNLLSVTNQWVVDHSAHHHLAQDCPAWIVCLGITRLIFISQLRMRSQNLWIALFLKIWLWEDF